MGYGLEYVAVRGDVADGPLAQPRAAQPEHVAAGLCAAVLLQPGLHLVVGEKGHVARVLQRQDVPVAQQRRPRLKQSVGGRCVMVYR